MYRLAAGAATLRSQVDKRWPLRDRASDGWIGDASHQKRKSDHNPDARGIVHAIDLDKDGIDAERFVTELAAYAASGQPGSDRILNIVWAGRVWSGTYRDHFWTPRAGDYGHFDHVHVSSTATAETNAAPYPLPCLRVSTLPQVRVHTATWSRERPYAASKMVALILPGRMLSVVGTRTDGLGNVWLGLPSGNYVLARRTSYRKG